MRSLGIFALQGGEVQGREGDEEVAPGARGSEASAVGLELFLFLDENPRVGCTCRLRAGGDPPPAAGDGCAAFTWCDGAFGVRLSRAVS